MSCPRVLIIDAGLGNIGSVFAAFQRQDCLCERLQEPPAPESASDFTHVVLPGVGSFKAGMDALRTSGWDTWIKEMWFQEDRPFLGICLGMQLLASEGMEGSHAQDAVSGLDLIPGRVDRLNPGPNHVLPHVGWNSLDWEMSSGLLMQDLPQGGDMYFVHSYTFVAHNSAHRLAFTDYGQQFTSVVGRGSCIGVQFHPEKSQRLGRRFLENFLGLPAC